MADCPDRWQGQILLPDNIRAALTAFDTVS